MANPNGGKATPLTPNAFSGMITGSNPRQIFTIDEWFGPGQPMTPVAPAGTGGRAFDYPVSANITYVPKTEANSQGITFDQLRNLADNLDILRLVIETRKDQIANQKWVIKLRDDDSPKPRPGQKSKVPGAVKEMTDFFHFPDGQNDFHAWLRLVLEDLFVVDAPALYVQRTKGGKVMGFEPIDGTTIKRLLDEGGRTPQAPAPAYQQILKGLPAADLSTDDLIYAPRNMRNHMIYGYSPVEQIVITANMAIRRMLGQLAHFTDGSVPEAVAQVPDGWTAEQVEQFQDYWDSMLAGNDQQRRHMRFMPHGTAITLLKPELLTDKMDEWLAKIVCYAFSVSSSAFASQVNRATAQTAQQQSLQEGLAPILLWIQSLMNRLLRQYMGHPELEFCWDEEEAVDPLIQAQIDEILVNTGIITVDEARDKRGYEPLPEPVVESPVMPLAAPFDPANPEPAHTGTAQVTASQVPPVPASGSQSKVPAGSQSKVPAGSQSKVPAGSQAKVPAGPQASAEKLAKASGSVGPEAQSKHEKALRAGVKKFFRSQAGKIAAQITSQVSKVEKSESPESRASQIIKNLDLNTDALARVVQPVLEDATTQAAEDAAADLPDGAVPAAMLKVVNDKAVAYAQGHTGSLVKGIDEATRKYLAADVIQCLNEGLSTAELAELLVDGYAFSDARAETIARTEANNALNQGTMTTWQESGVVSGKTWIVGDGCCDDCADLDGETVDLDEDFPGDVGDAPPGHPNCRCSMTAVLSDDSNSESNSEGE